MACHINTMLFFSCSRSFPHQKKRLCDVSGRFQYVPSLSATYYGLIRRRSEYPNHLSRSYVSARVWLIGQCYHSLRASRVWLVCIPRQFSFLFGADLHVYKHLLVWLKFKSWEPSSVRIYSARASIPAITRRIEENKSRIWTPQVCASLY